MSALSHGHILPCRPQSNGKIECWHQTLKGDALRPAQPATLTTAPASTTWRARGRAPVRPSYPRAGAWTGLGASAPARDSPGRNETNSALSAEMPAISVRSTVKPAAFTTGPSA